MSAGPELTNHRKDSHVHQLPVYYDSHPWRMKYGDLHVDANTHYQPVNSRVLLLLWQISRLVSIVLVLFQAGTLMLLLLLTQGDLVVVEFVSANPRNSPSVSTVQLCLFTHTHTHARARAQATHFYRHFLLFTAEPHLPHCRTWSTRQ